MQAFQRNGGATRSGRGQAARWTLPLLMQEVQTFSFLAAPPATARTGCKLTFQRRLVTLRAWLMRFPKRGPRPRISRTLAMGGTPRDTTRISSSAAARRVVQTGYRHLGLPFPDPSGSPRSPAVMQ